MCGVTAPLRRRLVPQRLVDQAQELIAADALDTAQWLLVVFGCSQNAIGPELDPQDLAGSRPSRRCL